MSRIGVDVDGVLADFNTAYIDLCIKLSNRDLFPARPFDIPCWSYPEFYGYTKEEVRAVWAYINKEPNFWRLLQRYPWTTGALDLLAQADVSNHDVYFITTRSGMNPKQQTIKWIVNNGFYAMPSVIVSKDKGPIAQGLELDAFIDDKVENCVEVAKHRGLACKVYMFNQPWNASFTDLRSIKRVSTMDEFFKEVL